MSGRFGKISREFKAKIGRFAVNLIGALICDVLSRSHSQV